MRSKSGLGILTAVFFTLFSISFLAVSGTEVQARVDKNPVLESYGNLPLYFIENKGQMDPRIWFYVKTPGQTLYFTENSIVFDLLRKQDAAGKDTNKDMSHQPAQIRRERLVFNLAFENAGKGALIEGTGRQDGKINYFVGNDRRQWKTDIATYNGVLYKGIYKGIDLKVFGNGRAIEYEFIVHPGGNPEDILLSYEGIDGLETDSAGELLIKTAFGELRESRPYIYQEIGGEKAVEGRFEIHPPAGQAQRGKFLYGFQIASYNPSCPLIIDPTLSYSTYLGGSGEDYGLAIAVDGSGCVYITGTTHSSNFPVLNPYQRAIAGDWDAFITKLSASGDTLVYSTYLGGTGFDRGYGIAVDASGCAYVTGETYSGNFPTKNPFQLRLADNNDAFITKLSESGNDISYSTYLGGTGEDYGNDIAVDSSGNACVAGSTQSANFPTKNPFQATLAGHYDGFITSLSASGASLLYSTYLGGSSEDYGDAIAIDGSGNAYVAGSTQSTDFPTSNAYQATNAGGWDAVVAKLPASGSSLSFSTYLGGTKDDLGYGIALDGSGNPYVTGKTNSGNFPTQNPYQGSLAGDYDAFIAKLPASGNTLSYATYLGGTGFDCAYGIVVNGDGYIYVAGDTTSSNFPTQNPYQGSLAGNQDAFVTKFEPSGTLLSDATYLGGSNYDGGYGIAIDTSGNVYVAGYTYSADFPTQKPYQAANAGQWDAFITKFQGQDSVIYVNKDDGTCKGNAPCYTSIQGAMNAASTGASLRVAKGDYTESIVLNTSKSVTLECGWDPDFLSQSSGTTLTKAPGAPQGSLTLRMLTIKP
ncbi:MAG: hypothetical protein QG552_2708 [Thermodesulfobacteriota bacterium]|nr:hypothetical protein [Thermodesulfobacteriota bacterium]